MSTSTSSSSASSSSSSSYAEQLLGFNGYASKGEVDKLEELHRDIFLTHSHTRPHPQKHTDPLNRHWTALHYACRNGRYQACSFLLTHGHGEEINCLDDMGCSPLHVACHGGIEAQDQAETVRVLVEHGCDVNILEEEYGYTALHLACLHEYPLTVLHLLAHGANIHLCSKKCETPLLVSVYGCRSTAAIFLDQAEPDAMITMLLEHGANLHHVDKEGNTVLHHSVTLGLIKCTKLLLHASPSLVHVGNEQGDTPLHTLCMEVFQWHGRELLHLLMDAGANMTQANHSDMTPYTLAPEHQKTFLAYKTYQLLFFRARIVQTCIQVDALYRFFASEDTFLHMMSFIPPPTSP